MRNDAVERLCTIRGLAAYTLHVPLHWLNIALLPYAGDWIYRNERREARVAQAIEARRAETRSGSVHESAVGLQSDAPQVSDLPSQIPQAQKQETIA